LNALRRIAFILLLSILILGSLAYCEQAENGSIVNTGHRGKVMALRSDAARNILVSGGEDGTIQVWDGVTQKPRTILRISSLPIRRLALHPTLPQVAIIESDNISTYTLSVWDYEGKKRIFSIALSEAPLMLEYSPSGSFIIASKADWESLRFVDSQTGTVLPYLSQGFGIITSTFLSQSEKTVITYSPSGSIQYWDLQGGTRKAEFVTNQDLEAISYTPNGLSMVGANKDNIFHIELVGKRDKDRLKVIASIPLKNVLCTAVLSQYEAAVASYSDTSAIYIWNLQSTYLRRIETDKPLQGKPTALRSLGGKLYLSFEDGSIASVNPLTGYTEFFGKRTLIDIEAAAINGETLLLAYRDAILSLASDYLSGQSGTLNSLTATRLQKPFTGRLGISALGEKDFLIYPEEGETGKKAFFSLDNDLYNFYEGYPAPFLMTAVRGERLLTLDKNGTVSLIEIDTGRTLFSYTAYGIKTVSFARDGNIVAGRNKTQGMQNSLLLIDPDTGETVAINDDNLVTFALSYDETTDRLYSLGFETRNGRQKTVLKGHSGSTYERVETLLAYAGEDAGATLTLDEERSKLYTSIGYGTVNILGYEGFTSLEEQNHIPESLMTAGGFLFSLNRDSSVTVWNTKTGRIAMEIYLFTDESILCILPDGNYAAIGGAERYLIRQ
jgi:WD40 repeat protein